MSNPVHKPDPSHPLCRFLVRPARPRRGFTLLELLVVIGLIATLAGLLLPALAASKGHARACACLNSVKQVALASLLYTDDFNDRLPYNLGSAEIRQLAAQGRYLNWSTPIMNWELDSDNTNSVLLTEGGIGPYTSRNAKVYRCPSDAVVSDIQAAAGWTGRVRSFSMNAMVGDAGTFSSSGANVNNPLYRQFFRTSQMPTPNQVFIFIEEHPDSVNDGYFLNKPNVLQWSDLPASYHRGAVNLSYGDGHLELHKWVFSSTRPPARPDAAQLPFPIPQAERGDFDWLMVRTTVDSYSYGRSY